MVGKWIDLVVLVFLALGLLKGFKKGLIRELFSLMGAILAIIIAYHSYQSLALVLLERYALSTWQAQSIAFVVLLIGISLLAAFFGYVWSKALSYTPFSVIDHLGGAVFGVVKVVAVVLIVLVITNAANIAVLNTMLSESIVVQQIDLLMPYVYEYLDRYWPEEIQRPSWLFPALNTA
ncbi:MAG TPA: CvpA family protein [Firmicutes bacterium]|jgi:membrane protein required for colicin V production|nr:CvpA family protein [Bacillota bacterium]